ncbi:MAG: GDP-mannose dehydrogenase, partial [Bacteroidetes bacterium]|nr:GDP-mannose dehydrogenase [Bacteroidota bacterium]
GVDLIKVINAIKMRPTHSNMIFPGPGIGGYCLPKDGGLGYWAYRHILGFEDGDNVFQITPTAIDINDTRGLHVAELTRDALRNMGRYIAGSTVLLAGASYRQDVGDTRYSGSEMVVRKLTEMGAEMLVHDPYVDHWYEFETQDDSPEHSWSRFFRNQDHLREVVVQKDLQKVIKGVDALILAVPHKHYLDLDPAKIVKWAGGPIAIVDAFGILTDDKIKQYFKLGCEVKALGRGHIQRLKKEVKDK